MMIYVEEEGKGHAMWSRDAVRSLEMERRNLEQTRRSCSLLSWLNRVIGVDPADQYDAIDPAAWKISPKVKKHGGDPF